MLAGSASSVGTQFATLETIDVLVASEMRTSVGTLTAREITNDAESMQQGLASFVLESKQPFDGENSGNLKG